MRAWTIFTCRSRRTKKSTGADMLVRCTFPHETPTSASMSIPVGFSSRAAPRTLFPVCSNSSPTWRHAFLLNSTRQLLVADGQQAPALLYRLLRQWPLLDACEQTFLGCAFFVRRGCVCTFRCAAFAQSHPSARTVRCRWQHTWLPSMKSMQRR